MHFEVKYCILPSFQKIFSGKLSGYDTELGCLISKEDTAKFLGFLPTFCSGCSERICWIHKA